MWCRKLAFFVIFPCLLSALISACGGGGSSTPLPAFTAGSGVAQKGPLIKGSTVTAQELDASLSPTGQQFTYQITSDLGTFSPTSTFTSQYIGLNATGYYFDEVANAVSSGTVTLNGYSDLAVDSVLNVNLMTTLAYQRIEHLVTGQGLSFTAARTQAESEVLAALGIPPGDYGSFGTLDLSGGSDGDQILAAVSSLFVYGNAAGPLSQLIADFQSDIGANGVITNTATNAALAAAAKALDPATIAANLTQEYASKGLTFTTAQISDWIDQDGDGVVGKFEFQVPGATASSVFTFPSFVSAQFAGTSVSVTAGQLAVNGTVSGGAVTIQSGDVITLAADPGTLPNGVAAIYLQSGTVKLSRVTFIGSQSDTWSTTGELPTPLENHTSTLLANGMVLVAGGNIPTGLLYTAGAALYDPVAGTWSTTGSLSTARANHSATLLQNGNVLVAGGLNNGAAIASAELYDPVAGAWSTTGSLAVARAFHTATLLPNGKVLVVGGGNGANDANSAELYDPAAGAWSPAGALPAAIYAHTATLLSNGSVLVAGGFVAGTGVVNSAELYDPAAGTWSMTGSMSLSRAYHTATLLASGEVLVAGGEDPGVPPANGPLSSAELYDPVSGTWSATGNMSFARAVHTAMLLPDDTVLVAGGIAGSPAGGLTGPLLSSAELYDPVAGTWSTTGSLATARAYHTATLLQNGAVLAAGGDGGANNGVADPLASSELYW